MSRAIAGCFAAVSLLIGLGTACSSSTSAPPPQCETVCVASCQRAQQCAQSNTADCSSACQSPCAGVANEPDVDLSACLAQIQGLSCAEVQQLAGDDTSVLMGKCG